MYNPVASRTRAEGPWMRCSPRKSDSHSRLRVCLRAPKIEETCLLERKAREEPERADDVEK